MKPVALLLLIIVSILIGFLLKTIMVKKHAGEYDQTVMQDRQTDEAGIRKTEAAYDNAWQQRDIEGIMVCFTEDAIIMSPRGDIATGKEQVRDLLSGFLANEGKGTRHTSRINRISFITDDVAIVDGEAFIEGSDHLSKSSKHHRFTDILVNNGNGWLISQIRAHANN